jgi:NAD-dependent dihydropyrimidine dehydrogenase PreA subunit
MSKVEVVIDSELCDGDGLCVENCPNEALGMKDGKAYVIDPELCGECYYCESICPNNGIRVQRND